MREVSEPVDRRRISFSVERILHFANFFACFVEKLSSQFVELVVHLVRPEKRRVCTRYAAEYYCAVLLIPRAEFSIEEPWSVPPQCVAAPLHRSTNGADPRLPTKVAAYFDDERLTVIFTGIDDDVIATYRDHDAPLYEEDVVEIFLAPDKITRYFEIEVNPLGTTFDAVIDSRDGVRATMRADLGWTCHGLFAAIRRAGDVVDTVIRIPFASLERERPVDSETWLGNFFRIDRGRSAADEFSAWRPTMKDPPDFHVAAAFGELRFSQ